jgi:hypothetical protein
MADENEATATTEDPAAVAATPAETQPTAVAAETQTTDAAATTAEADATAGVAEGEKPASPAVDWRERRIAQLTAQLHAEKNKNASAGAKQEDPAAGTTVQRAGESVADFEARVASEVEARTQLNEFNRACNEAADVGRKTFGEAQFNGRIAELTKLVNGQDVNEVQRYNTFISAALETGEAPKIIHALGGDLNEASRIMALPPVKMGIELAKLAAKIETPVAEGGDAVTRAPKPITPIGSRHVSAADIDPNDKDRADLLPTAEWMRKREAAVAKSRASA